VIQSADILAKENHELGTAKARQERNQNWPNRQIIQKAISQLENFVGKFWGLYNDERKHCQRVEQVKRRGIRKFQVKIALIR
jgi:hypothetical protein